MLISTLMFALKSLIEVGLYHSVHFTRARYGWHTAVLIVDIRESVA